MTDIDWSKWHKLDQPTPRPAWSDAKVTVSCSNSGLLSIGFNKRALQDLGLVDRIAAGSIGCDVFEGMQDQIGKLFVRWSDKGDYKLVSSFKGKAARVIGIETDWAPEKLQRSQVCKHVIVVDQGIEIDLPDWFDRELYREADRREAAEHVPA